MSQEVCVARKPWGLDFTAEPEEVAVLRRIMRLRLSGWGLPDIIDSAQLCVSELVANVITHVGRGTPATLAVSMSGTYLRVEVHDPDTRALPTLLDSTLDAESGRGMALVDAIADRWGVLLRPDRKVTWCELATRPPAPPGHVGHAPQQKGLSRLGNAMAEAAAVSVITDVLHSLRARDCDVDEVLDRAQTRFEAETERPPSWHLKVSPSIALAGRCACGLERIRALAHQVQEIDEAWAQESVEFPRERGAAQLRPLSPYEEVEGDYARVAWKVASALAREALS